MKKLTLFLFLMLSLSSSFAQGFPRVQVIEEATGTWCQWCPRTIVGCEQLSEKYGDKVIILAAHAEDAYATDAYAPLFQRCTSGYPSAFINRSLAIGTYPDQIETAYNAYASMGDAEGEVRIVEAAYTDSELKSVTLNIESRFARTQQNANYRIALAVVEDSIYARQANGYAGGTTEMGGFEKKGTNPYIYHNNVVRHIDYYGIEGSVPTTVKAGTTYTFTHTFTLPTLKNRKHMRIVALLQNAEGTTIYNADCTRSITDGTDGVHPQVQKPKDNEGSSKSLHQGAIIVSHSYDLQGKPIK